MDWTKLLAAGLKRFAYTCLGGTRIGKLLVAGRHSQCVRLCHRVAGHVVVGHVAGQLVVGQLCSRVAVHTCSNPLVLARIVWRRATGGSGHAGLNSSLRPFVA